MMSSDAVMPLEPVAERPRRAPRLRRWWDGRSGAERLIVVSAVGLVLLLFWAAFARIDEVARAQGKVIPSSKLQLIQSAQPATIAAILVRAGQRVHKGQLLVRLDDTDTSSALGQLQAENRALSARAARLGSEGEGDSQNCPPGSTLCQEEAVLQSVRASALRSKLSALNAATEQRRRALGEAQATAAGLRSSIVLQQRQVDMLEPLAGKAIVPQTELLQARRDLVDLQSRLAAAVQTISRSSAAVQEAQAQASEAGFEFRQQALDERSQVAAKIAVNEQSLRGASGRLDRTELRSPADGVVNDLRITTIGGFANAGEKIMEVVPVGDRLQVEARVNPKDIAFIHIGDKALVKVSAYDFSIYGGLDGRVTQVSADSIYDDRTKEAYFTVIVETDKAFLVRNEQRLPISPGMICDVQIVTGRRSILSYLLKPVLKARSEALREH